MSEDSEDGGEVHETLLPSLTLSVLGQIASDSEIAEPYDPAPPSEPHSGDSTPTPSAIPSGGRPRGAARGDTVGGRYIVEGQIGRGGMGRVMRVRHQVLGKGFALKLIKAPIANKQRIREMFYREARLASALSHANICSIVDFGEDPVFGLFMVMELLDGKTLHHKMRQDGRFAPKVACDIMWQIVEAVRYIHSRAVVHGDIKSENILLVRGPDRRRQVKLLDFGLARPDAGLRTERVEGTPEYLAPERIRDGAPASQASDIYALGILFYELLAGELPFRGTVEEIFQQHVEDTIPKIVDKIDDHTFDERADEIIFRATARDPKDRHPDAAGFLYELRTLMNMLGMDTARRRVGSVDPEKSPRSATVDRSEKAAAEVFAQAPVPLASVNERGKVRVANQAFLEFLGAAGSAAGIELADSGFTDIYPAFLDDLAAVLSKKTTIKRILYLSEGGGTIVQVAVILRAASSENKVSAGEVHLTLHPLSRLSASAAL